MSWLRNVSALWALGFIVAVAPACSSTPEEEGDEEEGALTEVSKPGQWVVDMAKVKKEYCGGESCTSKYFLGLAPHEAGMCKLDANGRPEPTCAAMEQQGLIVWDQGFRFKSDHSPVGPTDTMPVVKLEGSNEVVKMRGAHVNIIPMLKETDPLDQKHIGEWLQNGDVLVYFHPETYDQSGLMDRRTSHVAMYYEQKDASGKVIARHHIDNPNSYGPQFNHSPDRQMPFHVFRYKPKGMSAEASKAYGLNSRNWAFITDDISPFADFFDLRLQNTTDLRSIRDKALAGQEILNLYCSGLAYANINLGVNYPLKPGMIRASGYNREETNNIGPNAHKASELAPAETQSLSAPAQERLVFEPYTPTDLATAFVDNIYQALPPVAEQGKPSRKMVMMNPALQEAIVGGFAQLSFSDASLAEKQAQAPGGRRAPDGASVATPETVKAWADAYALPASDTAAWLERNPVIKDGVTKNAIDIADKTPMQVLRAVELKIVQTKFVGPRIWLDEADHRQWAMDPRMFQAGLQQKAETDMVYVGSVLNCEILTAADGSNSDACAGFGGLMREWKEGGADTATYAHYALKNGKERTHRRFDASAFSTGQEDGREIAPRPMGTGTQITVRASTPNAKDVYFLFHTPEMNGAPAAQGGLSDAHKALSMKDYDAACTQIYAAQGNKRGTCAPKRAILLEPGDSREVKRGELSATGQLYDDTLSYDLLGPNGICTVVNAEKMSCPIAEKNPTTQKWDYKGKMEVSRIIPKEKAFVSATMVEIGQQSGAADIYNCTECSRGGAHFNQWTIKVRND